MRNFLIRIYQPDDFDLITGLWKRARYVAYPQVEERMGHTLEEDRGYFCEHILPENEVWVAVLGEDPVGFLAIQGEYIDHLYVSPDHHRQGIGSRLLEHAKTLSPTGLRLATLQVNRMAHAFYEKNGFRAVRFGVSPPPESEPDVEYHWKALE